MKKLILLLPAALILTGCTHINQSVAVSQQLFSQTAQDAISQLNIPYAQMKGKKVGFEGTQRTTTVFSANSVSRSKILDDSEILLEEKLLEQLRTGEIELDTPDKADLEYVVQSEINGTYSESVRTGDTFEYKIQLHAYLYDLKDRKTLHVGNTSSRSKFNPKVGLQVQLAVEPIAEKTTKKSIGQTQQIDTSWKNSDSMKSRMNKTRVGQ